MTNIQSSTRKGYNSDVTKVAKTPQDRYADWLQTYPWKYFCTFTTRYELTLKSARRLMDRYQAIVERETCASMRIFWVCEKFELKDGFHLHALMDITPNENGRFEIFPQTDTDLFTSLRECYQVAAGSKKDKHTGKFDTYHRVQFKRYNPKQQAGRYCVKYVLKEQGNRIEADYDLLI